MRWLGHSGAACPQEVQLACATASATCDRICGFQLQCHVFHLCPLVESVSSVIVVILYAPSLIVCIEITQDNCSVSAVNTVEGSGHVDGGCGRGAVPALDSGEAYLDFANVFVEGFALPFRVFVIYIGGHCAVEV